MKLDEPLKRGLMSDFELALWSLSSDECDMLKRYAQHYRQEYGYEQVQQKSAERSVDRGLDTSSSRKVLPQDAA